jgi:hypothetical protein
MPARSRLERTMSTRTAGLAVWIGETNPRTLDAYPITTTVDVMDRQVEVTIDFATIPHAILNEPKKFISRDPAVVEFMRRIHTGIDRRFTAADIALGATTESEDVA